MAVFAYHSCNSIHYIYMYSLIKIYYYEVTIAQQIEYNRNPACIRKR